MPRQNKKSRIKGLPARLQLQQKDAATGSYPSNVRTSSDNRTGEYSVSYDDTKTITFGARKNILDNVISYWRFNSGSSVSPIEVFQTDSTPPSGSYTIYPAFLSDKAKNYQSERHMSYKVAEPGTWGHFTPVVPFSGPADDANLTSLSFYPLDQHVISGNISFFNPGSTVATPGENEKQFSISFWSHLYAYNGSATPTFQSLVNITLPSGIMSSSISPANEVFTMPVGGIINIGIRSSSSRNELYADLLDPNGNTISLRAIANMPYTGVWKHVVISYDGTKTTSGIKIYFDGEQITDTLDVSWTALNGTYVGMTSSFTEHQLYIGRIANDVSTQLDADMDELIFFDRVLSEGEIKDIFSNTRSLHKPKNNPLLGIYHGANVGVNSPFLDVPIEQTTSLFGAGSVVKGIGDSIAHFTPGQEIEPFKDHGNPAVDGKSSGNAFYARGSKASDVGEGFEQPLWSKTKIEIDISTAGDSSFSTFFSRSNASLGFVSGTNYPMAYYNFDNKGWDGIGIGRPISSGVGSARNFVIQGFAGGLVDDTADGLPAAAIYENFMDLMMEMQAGAGHVTDKYGFPFDARYHGTSSQTFPMSSIISKPFVVEKIVIEFSGALTFDPNIQNGAPGTLSEQLLTASFMPAAVSNIFILNQRRPGELNFENSEYLIGLDNDITDFTYIIPRMKQLTSGSTGTYVDTTRDIITYGGITSFASNITNTIVTRSADAVFVNSPNLFENPKSLLTRELNIETGIALSNSLVAMNWSGEHTLELVASSPNKNNNSFSLDAEGPNPSVLRNTNGGRNGLGVTTPSGRSFRSPVSDIQKTTETNLFGTGLVLVKGPYKTVNPYTLYPSDNLIIGFQQPLPTIVADWQDITTGTGSLGGPLPGTGILSTMTFTGPAKIILYGSSVKEGKEHHDTLNQLLTSNTVHEVIG